MVDIIPDPSVRKAMNEINAGDTEFSLLFDTYLYRKNNFCS